MSRSLREILNEGNANKIPNAARDVRLGNALAVVPRYFRGTVTSHILTLPEASRAAVILRGYTTIGTTLGEVTPLKSNAAPSSSLDAAPNALGNVLFLAADAVTEAEILYVPYEGDVVEDVIAVASHVGTPLGSRAVALLLEAEALTGGSAGAKTIVARGTAAPSAGQAALLSLPTSVRFAAADAVTSARIKYIAAPGFGDITGPVGTALEAQSRSY
jgi:hypothetical protein